MVLPDGTSRLIRRHQFTKKKAPQSLAWLLASGPGALGRFIKDRYGKTEG